MNSLLQTAYAIWKDGSAIDHTSYTIQSTHSHFVKTTPVARSMNNLDYISPQVFHPDQVTEHQQVSIAAFPQVTLEVMRTSPSTPSLSHIVGVVSDYLRFFQRVLPASGSAFKDTLHLGLAFSPIQKRLPTRAGSPIEPEHVNGGVTWKQHGLVIVYRQEEWEKVLLHELLHFYEFDYHPSSMPSTSASVTVSKALAKENNIQTRHGAVALNEAYVETLTTLLYVAYSILRSHAVKSISYSAFKTRWRKAMATAQQHFHRQILKLLRHFRGGPWTETTHAFAYFVCKAALLFDLKGLLAWSDQHQTTIRARLQNNRTHVDAYARFLESCLNAPRFANMLCKLAKTMSIKNQKNSSLIMLSFHSKAHKIT